MRTGTYTTRMIRWLAVAAAILAPAAVAIAQGWSTPVDVSNTSELWEAGQSFTVDSRGKVHITYATWNDNTSGQVYYTSNDTPDGSFAAPTVVPIPGYWLYDHTTQLTHDLDDTLHLVVTVKVSGGTGAENVIYMNKPRGGAWSHPLLLTSDTTEFTRSHGIATLPDGSIFVLMVDDNDGWPRLFDRVRNPSGVWSGEETLYTSDVNGRWPSGWCGVIDGDIYVSYDRPFCDGAFYKAKHNGTWSSWKQISNYNVQTGSRLTLSKSPVTGEMSAVFGCDAEDGANFGTYNLNFDIYARFSNDGGTTWGPQVRVSPGNSLDRGATGIYDASGAFHVVWYGQVNLGDYGSALYRKRRADGVWEPMVNVSNNYGRSGAGFQAIQRSGSTLHFVYVNSGNPPSGPGYEDAWYTRMDLPSDPTPPAPVAAFSAISGEKRAYLSWTNPIDSDFSATIVRMSTAGYPTTPSDGTSATYRYAQPGSSDAVTIWPITAGATYYFSAFAQDTSGNYSTPAHATALPAPDVSAPAEVSGFTAAPYTTGNMTLAWTNPSDVDFRGTMIRCRTDHYPTSVSDGSLVCDRLAAPGEHDTFLHTQLAPGVTYYYAAFTYDQDVHYSPGAHAVATAKTQTCFDAKLLADGSPADLKGKVVSAIFVSDGCIYVQEPDQSSGIRVSNSGTGLAVGDTVNVSGTLSTRLLSSYASERQISSAAVTRISAGAAPAPLAMNCRAVGGAAVGLAPGVKDGVGINSMGLLVRICGKVTYKAGNYLFIDDGSGVENLYGLSTPEVGVMAKCATTPVVNVGDMVSATGIIEGSVPNNPNWKTNRAYLHLRNAEDLRKF